MNFMSNREGEYEQLLSWASIFVGNIEVMVIYEFDELPIRASNREGEYEQLLSWASIYVGNIEVMVIYEFYELPIRARPAKSYLL